MAQWGEANGTIASINTQTRTMALNTDNGTLTLEVAVGARITKNGDVYGLRGLNAGDVVEKVVYRTRPTRPGTSKCSRETEESDKSDLRWQPRRGCHRGRQEESRGESEETGGRPF